MESTLLVQKLESLRPHLDERQWRLLLAAEARSLGHGGVSQVATAAKVTRATIHVGLNELDGEPIGEPGERTRREGGGRKKLQATKPELVEDLLRLVTPETRGNPMSPLLYTSKSTRHLAEALEEIGHKVSKNVVAGILASEGYSLQANVKSLEAANPVDRNAQFEYINRLILAYQTQGQPVISVDTKKKELIGNFKNAGQQWLPKKSPVKVNVHDFPSQASGKAIPYGVYDIANNSGWVSVGTDHDTSEFAVSTISCWWHKEGKNAYPQATKLLITADGGGSNGSRNRLWKARLAELAAETGLLITVCHLPPGTSKWNKIEHRLFSHISMNWQGEPLTSHEVVIGLISATTTNTGLKVRAELDTKTYPKNIKITDEELAELPLRRHHFRGDWNYTLLPSMSDTP